MNKSCTSWLHIFPKHIILHDTIVNETVCILFLDCSLVVYRNMTDFLYVDLVSCNFDEPFTNSKSYYFCGFLGFSVNKIISFSKRDSFTSSYVIWMPLIFSLLKKNL